MTRSADPAEIQAEIEATRARLGRTVDQIGNRLDVRAHAREKAFVARDTVVETYRESPPAVVGAALALVGLATGLVVWRRKRADKRRKR